MLPQGWRVTSLVALRSEHVDVVHVHTRLKPPYSLALPITCREPAHHNCMR